MKVLMVTNNFTPYTGGVVSSIKALVHELHALGHEVLLVTLDFGSSDQDNFVWVKRIYCPIQFIYKKNYMAIPWRPKKQISEIIDQFNPDIIHLHHPFLLGTVALHCAQKKKIPTVFTYHTIYESYAHYVPLPHMLAIWLIRRCVRSFCAQVDGIIAPSDYVYRSISRGKAQIRIIPSGLTSEFLGAVHKKEISDAPIKLLTVSRMVKEKNVSFLLDVAQQLSAQSVPFHFTLIGYGAEYERLQAYAYEQLQLPPDRVIFIHKPAKELIVQAYKDADLFLYASTTDTQGLVLAESMAAATPVIAIDGPGQRDIVKNGVNGYIVHSQDEMVRIIAHIAQHRNECNALSHAALQTAQLYHPAAIAARCVAFYAEVMDARTAKQKL